MVGVTPISIIGGGFSGLIQAFYLIEAGLKVKIYEKSDRLGGLLGSHYHGDFLIEQAANAFLANSEIERISDIIGVPLFPTKESAKKRYIYKNGKMRRWPLGFSETIKLFPFAFDRIRKKPMTFKKDETLKEWEERCLGKGASDYLFDPAMQGVFATTGDRLDAKLVIESIFRRRPRGKLKGSVSPAKGMGQWIEGMVNYLKSKGCEFEMNSEKIPEGPKVFAVSIKALKELKSEIDLPKSLENVETASLTSVVLLFEDQSDRPEGFGCLFPKKENFNSLGVLFNRHIFEGRVQQGESETWILNDQSQKYSEMDEERVLHSVLEDREKLTGVKQQPLHYSVHQWPNRIPLYDIHLRKFLEELKASKSSHLFVGHAYGDLGLSKLIFRAKENAEKVRGGFFG